MLSGFSLVCTLPSWGKSEEEAPVDASIVRGGGAGIRPALEAGEGPSEAAAVAVLSVRHRFTAFSGSATGVLAASSVGNDSCTVLRCLNS